MDLTNLNKDRKNRKKSASLDPGIMMYGKVPPQAKELEEAILGAIMLEKNAFEVVADILKPQCFYVEAHQRIFSAMMDLAQKNFPIDLVTVVEQLKFSEELDMVGGPYYVSKLTNAVVSSANIEFHSRIVIQKWIQRELIRISGEVINESYKDSCDPLETLEHWEMQMTDISLERTQRPILPYHVELTKSIQRIEELRKTGNHITGIASGFYDIDKITHGWQKTDLIILAARPSVGKTAFALNIARNASIRDKIPVAFFSMEMSTMQLVNRNLAAESEIWLDNITNGLLDDDGMERLYNKGVKPQEDAELHIDDTPALNIIELRSKCRKLKRKKNIGMVIIDYLQLMSGTSDNRNTNREQEVSRISRELKGLAKELNIPIMALSQLSREPEKRKGENKRPQLSDLRESGAIEQDSDLVMFMYRPEYYDITTDNLGESTKGETHISITKHRNGRIATGDQVIKLRADLSIQKFYDWDSLNDVKPVVEGNWRPVRKDKLPDDTPF